MTFKRDRRPAKPGAPSGRPPKAAAPSGRPTDRKRTPLRGRDGRPAVRRPAVSKAAAAENAVRSAYRQQLLDGDKAKAAGPADGVRLQKLLSTAGVASRRASEQIILEGRVSVNGVTVKALGAKADPAHDDIRVDGRRIRAEVRQQYVVLYKPKGYVTTRDDPEGRRTVLDLLDRGMGYIYPVGRLDYDSEGLLLMTSDGDLAAKLTHPRHEVDRVYEAIVEGAPGDDIIAALAKGVFIDGRRTSKAEVLRGPTVKAGKKPTTMLTITLREGRNRQVRKMCAVVGHPVQSLKRISMGPITLGRMKPGDWRVLSTKELAELRTLVAAGTEKRPARR